MEAGETGYTHNLNWKSTDNPLKSLVDHIQVTLSLSATAVYIVGAGGPKTPKPIVRTPKKWYLQRLSLE